MNNFKQLMLAMLLALLSCATASAENYILYTSSDGNIVQPYSNTFGATIVSNTYENGQGRIEFDGEVTSIGSSAFFYCSSLTSINIPNSVTEIGSSAFNSCSGLTSVTIGNSVTSIGSSAFSFCHGLTSINIPNSVTSIGDYAFSGCGGIERIVIPNKVTSIGGCAFGSCSNLKSVIIGTGVLSVGNGTFSSCYNLYKMIILPNTKPSGLYLEGRINYVANSNYGSSSSIKKYDYLSSMFEVDGIIYVPVSPSKRTCAAIDCTYDENVKDITIGNTVIYHGVEMKVVEINPYVLIKNEHVESIKVSSDAGIQDYFANGCTEAKSIEFNSSGTVGDYSFCDCTSLSKINIPSSVESLGSYSFSGCTSLEEITLNEGLKTIGDYSFNNTKIASIVIPVSTTSIGTGVFNGCNKLSSFEAKDGNQVLNMGYNTNGYERGYGLFYDCPLKSVKIGRNLKYNTGSSYGYSPFYRNTNIESVIFTDVPTEVFTNEFYGCSGLTNVSLGDGVTKIGNYAFSGCSSIEEFSFGASVQEIGAEAFSDCTNMTKLYAEPAMPPTCGKQALDDINKWNCTLYIPELAKEKYMAADQWKEFFFMESYEFSNGIFVPTVSRFRDNGKTYNLQGVEVKDGSNGIVIRNGKKFVVK